MADRYCGTGRRKKSIAQVTLVPGTGTVTINGRNIDEYFGLETLKFIVRQPLTLTGTEAKFDVVCKVVGGGYTGQAGAIRHGIARALLANAKILIFDDSTSAVDTATEKKIRKELAKLGDVTKIIIAQRISSVIHTDRIVILDDGKIHNIGTHEQLLKEDAIYQEIYASQMKGGNSDGIENEEC